ncbi:hypothetical protein ABW19_dt0202340 [Dactylella cylindrospora]|nr:hypothetical protein ABW19_dt0202340 [Dactylella cylindrospora]
MATLDKVKSPLAARNGSKQQNVIMRLDGHFSRIYGLGWLAVVLFCMGLYHSGRELVLGPTIYASWSLQTQRALLPMITTFHKNLRISMRGGESGVALSEQLLFPFPRDLVRHSTCLSAFAASWVPGPCVSRACPSSKCYIETLFCNFRLPYHVPMHIVYNIKYFLSTVSFAITRFSPHF